ncbi:MAG: hypothetical protein IT454_16350 [Planctomycetes bacterium]|nr:hypothetical protein [Planctomycetota bacterium]
MRWTSMTELGSFLALSIVATMPWISACATLGATDEAAPPMASLSVPSEGSLPVAFVLGPDAEVLDFTGPLEVFAGAWTADWRPLFQPYFVAASLEPVTVSGGLRVVPDYIFADAPAPSDVRLWLHHDEDAEVYLNGVLALDVDRYTTSYELAPISTEARAALRAGRDVLAIHCRQTTGGQYVDVGLPVVE